MTKIVLSSAESKKLFSSLTQQSAYFLYYCVSIASLFSLLDKSDTQTVVNGLLHAVIILSGEVLSVFNKGLSSVCLHFFCVCAP